MREEHMWALVPQTKVPPQPWLVRICVLFNTRLDMCSHTQTHTHMHTHAHTLNMHSHSHVDMN